MLILRLTDGPSWNNLPVSTPLATSGRWGGFWRRDEGRQSPSPAARAGDARRDAVSISRDEASPSPAGPSPTTTTSHAAEEEDVRQAHTSLAIKVIFLISTSPSHPVTGHGKILIIPPPI